MVQFLSIFFFLGFLQFLLGFSKNPVFLCHSVYQKEYYSGVFKFGKVICLLLLLFFVFYSLPFALVFKLRKA